MARLSITLVLLGVVPLGVAGQAPKAPNPTPQWQRYLRGEDARRAEALAKELADAMRAGKRDEARKTAEAIVALRTRLQGADHWQVRNARLDLEAMTEPPRTAEQNETAGKAKALFEKVLTLYKQGQPADAVATAAEVVRLFKQVYGDRDVMVCKLLLDLTQLHRTMGQYAAAEPLAREAATVHKAVYGPRHPSTATALNELANLYVTQARTAEAEPLYWEALAIYREIVGDRHPATAVALHNLAHLYQSEGRFTEAEPLYQDALRIKQARGGGRDTNTASTLAGLAHLYQQQGRYAEAEPLYKEVVAIRRAVHGERHADTAVALNNLANLFETQRRSAEAEPLYHEALETLKATVGDRHPDTALVLNNLGSLYKSQWRHAEAEPLYREALTIRTAVFGERHPSTIETLANLGNLYDAQGKFADAEPLYRRVADALKDLYGDRHPRTATSLNNLAMLYFAQGKDDQAERLLAEAVRSYEAFRLLRARSVERSVGTVGANPYPPLAVVLARRGKPTEAFRALQLDLARGLLDEQTTRRGAGLTPAEQQERDDLAGRLTVLQARLSGLATRPKRSPAEEKELVALTDERRALGDRLAGLAAAASRRQVADLAEVRAALPPAAALVAWVDLSSTDGRTQEHWACVVLPEGEPRWERLPGSGPDGTWLLDDTALTGKLRDALAAGEPADRVADLTRQVYAQRLAPVEKHLAGIRTLYVAGVNEMAGVPVEVLLPDRAIGYVPSGTVLARKGKPRAGPATLLALADPVFPRPKGAVVRTALPPGGLLITQVVPGGAAAKARLQAGDVLVAYAGTKLGSADQLARLTVKTAGGKYATVDFWREADDTVATRDVAPGELGVVLAEGSARALLAARRRAAGPDGTWAELPGTHAEVTGLTKLFGPDRAKVLTRSDASEPALEALRARGDLAKFRYLHFATHGRADADRAFDAKLILSQDRPRVPTPAAGGPVLDNELTAGEVLAHWQLDADLVTLSACETALGKPAGGDGLLGFAQAFLLAGARSVCLSLWKVDDTATALLMDRFYRNLLGKREGLTGPMDKAAALREAKAWLRGLTVAEATGRLGAITQGVSRGEQPALEVLPAVPKPAGPTARPYAHPRYWAAFVLIGEAD